jgi:hypothetical protein
MDLGLRLEGETSAASAVLHQADALDRPLLWDAELTLAEMATPAWAIGTLARGHGMPEDAPLVRRVSGGAPVRLGPKTIHLALALRSPSVLFRVDAKKLINRYVRPLLRALTKSGAPAAYFGRDWISVGHRPAGIVGFAHDAGTGRAVFEAFVALSTPFSGPRPAFLGKEPGTLESILGRTFEASAIMRSIADAYLSEAGGAAHDLSPASSIEGAGVDEALRAEPPWAARVEEAIGPVCAGRDALSVLRLGGDFMASRDAIERLEASVVHVPEPAAEALTVRVNEAFGAPGIALEGVRDLSSLRTALLLAMHTQTR